MFQSDKSTTMMLMLLWSMLGLLVPTCVGYSGGPPDTVCDTMLPSHPGNPQTSTCPYQISLPQTTYSPGQTITGQGTTLFC